MRLRILAGCAGFAVSGLMLAGCGGLMPAAGTAAAATGSAVKGSVHGGQQAVSGATIQLYAVGTTGDGSAPTALLTSTVTTDANGGFTLTGLYPCTTPGTLVYLVATGGNPGLAAGTNNTALAEMAALGQCGSLGSVPLIQVTEATTVAAAAALAGFTTQPFNVGSGTSDAAALAAAFNAAATYADVATGASPGPGQATTAGPFTPAVPASTINTLANILAGCVNTTGPGSTGCSQLFALTGNPTNTLGAIMNLQATPALYNTASLFALAGATGPFQPQLSSAPANNFAVAVIPPTNSSTVVFAYPTTVSVGDAIWLVSSAGNCTYGSPSLIQIAASYYATGGTQQCGLLWGVVPSGVPYGNVGGYGFTSFGGNYNTNYPFYLNVVPKAASAISFSPTTEYWEGTASTHTSYGLDVTLKNNTTGSLTVGTAAIKGASPTSFSVTADHCSGITLTNSATCTMTLTFLPPNTTFQYATLVITATDASSKQWNSIVNLGGSGLY